MSEAVTGTIEYRVDRDNVIVGVNDAWRAFASDNGAEDLVEAEGRELLASISGDSTRLVTRHLLDRVRATRGTVEIPFRCDAPDRRRYMRLRLLPVGDGGVGFRSWLVREEARPPLAVLDIREARGDGLLRICSWCNKVAVDDGWMELEDAAERLLLFEAPTLPDITHGMCDGCETEVMQAI
ncbi:MAG: hypothetical protein R3253_08405 [Longimicrobiales bacterium]|nr:hypothetical protein [Longimicrobiales bacterium]